jgi:type IV secretory pathway TrbD component
MSGWLIAGIGVVYFVVALDLFFNKRDPAFALAFIGYVIGNVGLAWKAWS